jgi:hypothetical protein
MNSFFPFICFTETMYIWSLSAHMHTLCRVGVAVAGGILLQLLAPVAGAGDRELPMELPALQKAAAAISTSRWWQGHAVRPSAMPLPTKSRGAPQLTGDEDAHAAPKRQSHTQVLERHPKPGCQLLLHVRPVHLCVQLLWLPRLWLHVLWLHVLWLHELWLHVLWLHVRCLHVLWLHVQWLHVQWLHKLWLHVLWLHIRTPAGPVCFHEVCNHINHLHSK